MRTNRAIPLHFHRAADPARGCAVISGVDFHAAVQVHDAFPELVIAERLERQREQGRFLFGEHHRHLPFGSAVDTGIGPGCFPLIQVGLRFLQAFEALSLERCFLGVADSRFHFSFSIGMIHAAR